MEIWLFSSSSSNKINLWEKETESWLKMFEGHQDFVRSVVFSLDGKYDC